MAKKFAEHSGLDLTKTNQEVLSNWGNKDIFHRERMLGIFPDPPSSTMNPVTTGLYGYPTIISH